MLREDLDALDALADSHLTALAETSPDGSLPAQALGSLPAALRRRVLRGWLRAAGVPDVQAVHLHSVDALVAGWRGQGAVDLPGGAGAVRASGRLLLLPAPHRGGRPDAPDDLEEPPRD
jgi:hypothetical protein